MPGSIRSSTTRLGSRRSSSSRARIAVAGLERLVALAPQVADDDLADDRLVVDDQDGGHHGILQRGSRRCFKSLNSPAGEVVAGAREVTPATCLGSGSPAQERGAAERVLGSGSRSGGSLHQPAGFHNEAVPPSASTASASSSPDRRGESDASRSARARRCRNEPSKRRLLAAAARTGVRARGTRARAGSPAARHAGEADRRAEIHQRLSRTAARRLRRSAPARGARSCRRGARARRSAKLRIAAAV